MKKAMEVLTPDTRFGATFLDILFNEHAAKDEVMLDKESGDLAYKRKGDGRIMWYSQENIPLYTFVSQLRSRANSYTYYERPDYRSPVYENSYFMSCLLDMKDWVFDKDPDEEEGTVHSLLNGDKLNNCFPDAFSVSQDANGFYIQLNVEPKDLALIQLLNARYNMEYMSYAGEDEEALKKKELFNEVNYASSPFTLNYTVTWYDLDGNVKDEETADGYLLANEVSFIPYKKTSIYSRDEVNSTKLKINYLSAPKLAEAEKLCTTEQEQTFIRSVADTNDIAFQTMNFSFFFTDIDDNLYIPSWISHSEVLIFMGLRDFDEALERSAGSGGTEITTSIIEPDDKTWKLTNLWIELMRVIEPPNGGSYIGSKTTMPKLEDEINGILHLKVNFSLDKNSIKDFYVEKTGEINVEGGGD